MKVHSAIINAALITSRKRADGKHPIVIRVQFNGRAEKYLPHSVLEKDWDKKKQRVKTSNKSSSVINAAITREIAAIEQRKLSYERIGTPYTAKMLLDDKVQGYNISTQYRALQERMLTSKHYQPHTVRMFKHSYNRLKEYIGREDFLITEIDSQLCEGFARWMKNEKKVADGTICVVLARIGVVYKYAISLGIVHKDTHPFNKFKYWKNYKINRTRFGLSSDIMQMIENDYINNVCDVDVMQGVWSYKDGVVDKLLHKRSSELFVQCLLLMCYKMQGIALCDLLRIKSDNISVQQIGEDEYYLFKGIHRKKTNESIDVISVKKSDNNAVVFECFLNTMQERDGWFLPVLYNKENIDNTVQTMTQLLSIKIKKVLHRIDDETDNWISAKGIDIDKVTYYTFRHTFATVYVNEKQGNPVYLAQLMGRSVKNIYNYVNALNTVEALVKAKMED